MIKSFSIANFKAFGAEEQTIPLKPLTIVFGPNSSGKSTILHSLLFAHHTVSTGELDVVYPQLGERTVDLGGFRQFIHGADRGVANRLTWSVEYPASEIAKELDERFGEGDGRNQQKWRKLMADTKVLQVSADVGIPCDNQGIPIVKAHPRVDRLLIKGDGHMILSATSLKDDPGMFRIDQLAADHSLVHGIIYSRVETGAELSGLTQEIQRQIVAEVDAMILRLVVVVRGMLPCQIIERADWEDPEKYREDQGDVTIGSLNINNIPGTRQQFFQAMRMDLADLVDVLGSCVSTAISRSKYLGPLRSYPPRHLAFSEDADLESHAGGGSAWRMIAEDETIRAKVNQWLSKLKTPYRLEIESYHSQRGLEKVAAESFQKIIEENVSKFVSEDVAGAWNKMMEAWQESPDSDAHKTAAKEYAERVADIVGEGASDAFNRTLPVSTDSTPRDILLVDQRTKTSVSHRDVGIGISQVLPVLVNAYGWKNQIVAIEQPEIHLHPALQAELADVFIESALGDNRNHFLLETHSEHLILRILRRIRETTANKKPSDLPDVTPDDIALLYVDVNKQGAQVLNIRVDKHGRLIDRCPGGFFEEDFDELF